MSSNAVGWPWSELDLDGPPEDPKEVRRAYARKLKTIDADVDVAAFEALRSAYEFARAMKNDGPRRSHAHLVPSGELMWPEEPPMPVPPPSRKPRVADPVPPVAEETPPVTDDGVSANPWGAGKDLGDLTMVLDRMNALIGQRNWATTPWQTVFEAPALDDPVAAQVLERNLCAAFIGENDDYQAYVFSADFADLVRVVDRRFGWVSEGVDFLRRFPDARGLQADFSTVTRRASPRPKPVDPRGKPISPFAWVALFIGWIVVLNLLH